VGREGNPSQPTSVPAVKPQTLKERRESMQLSYLASAGKSRARGAHILSRRKQDEAPHCCCCGPARPGYQRVQAGKSRCSGFTSSGSPDGDGELDGERALIPRHFKSDARRRGTNPTPPLVVLGARAGCRAPGAATAPAWCRTVSPRPGVCASCQAGPRRQEWSVLPSAGGLSPTPS
jgi:hypothetical protein